MRAAVHLLARLLALCLVLSATGAVPLVAAALEAGHVHHADDGCSDCSPTCTCPCCPVRLAEEVSGVAPVPGAQRVEHVFASLVLRLPEGVRSDVFHPPSA